MISSVLFNVTYISVQFSVMFSSILFSVMTSRVLFSVMNSSVLFSVMTSSVLFFGDVHFFQLHTAFKLVPEIVQCCPPQSEVI